MDNDDKNAIEAWLNNNAVVTKNLGVQIENLGLEIKALSDLKNALEKQRESVLSDLHNATAQRESGEADGFDLTPKKGE